MVAFWQENNLGQWGHRFREEHVDTELNVGVLACKGSPYTTPAWFQLVRFIRGLLRLI